MKLCKDIEPLRQDGVSMETQIDIYKNDEKRLIALNNLYQNKDFLYLISEEYLKNEAARTVSIMDSEMAYTNDTLKAKNEAMLLGISSLTRWFSTIITVGQSAQDNIKSLEENEEVE